MPITRNTRSNGAPKRSASRLDRMPAITRTAPRRMAMLTESREAMNLIWPPQNLAIASLSSPHFDANPFLPAAPRHLEERPRRQVYVACVDLATRRVSKDGHKRLWPHPSRRRARCAAPQDDEEMVRKCRADVLPRWREPRVYGNLAQIRIKVT